MYMPYFRVSTASADDRPSFGAGRDSEHRAADRRDFSRKAAETRDQGLPVQRAARDDQRPESPAPDVHGQDAYGLQAREPPERHRARRGESPAPPASARRNDARP